MDHTLEQRIVPFYGDDLIAVQESGGAIFVLFARLCANLGLVRHGQVRRVQQHAILSEGFTTLVVQTDGGPQEAQCLRLDLLPLWMSGIQAKRVKPELQEKLARYQREAASVLWHAFKPRILVEETAIERAQDDQGIVELRRIAEMARAIAEMAEQQIELQRQQRALHGRMDSAARVIRGMHTELGMVTGRVVDVEVRLGVLEDRLQPAGYVTEQQAAEISNAVKALAERLSAREQTKNQYQSVFAELYRRFGATSYKHIRQDQYAAVLAFLEDWRTAVS